MVTGIFGTPGSGKSTYLCMIAQRELKKIKKGKSKYKHVLTNFPVTGCEQISIDDLGLYDISYSLILFDEITLDADSRNFKSFPTRTKNFFILHRHLHNDVIYFCQDFSQVDKIIRNVTFDLWYLYSPVIPLLNNFSFCRRIYRNININEYSSELTLGYRFPKFTEIIFSKCSKSCFRPRWYKYFDSYDKLQLDNLVEFDYKSW